MAIQVRRGFFINLDPNKLLTGEFAVSTDKQVVHIAFAPGVVKRLSTYEDMKADMQESLGDIIDNLTVSIKQATDNANNKANLAEQKAMLADAKAILADQKAQQAQAIIDSAAPIINTNLQASYADKATALTGTFITCPTADNGLAHVNKIVGETVQKVTVQGKNLFNGIFEQGHINASGGLYNDPMAIRTKDYIPVTSGLTYTKSNSLNRPSGRIAFYNNGVFVSAIVDVATFTVPSGVNQVKYSIYNTGNIVPSDVTWAQLELGSTATPYEPFTPNSPSSEYPSPLEYAKDFDAITCSDNLLPDEHQQSKTVSGVTFIRNSDGSITCNGTATANADYYIFGNYSIVRPYNFTIYANTDYTLNATGNSNVDILMVFGDDMANRNSFQTSTNNLVKRFTYDIRVFCGILRVKNGATVNNVTVYPQLTKGNVALPYSKYKGDKKSISFPFMSLPNGVKNGKEYINGVYSDALRIKEDTFNGNEGWDIAEITSSYMRFIRTGMTNVKKDNANDSGNISCDKFKSYSQNTIGSSSIITGISTHTTNGIQLKMDINMLPSPTLAGFKLWLSQNPIKVQYELETHIITPTDEIYLETNKGTTHFFTNSYPQVSMVVDFKSELESMRIKHEDALKSKFDANSEIEFTEATSDVDIVTKDTLPTLFGKILKSIKTLRSGLALKFDKSNIVQTDTVGGTDKVASAEVTKALGLEVDAINNNLANIGLRTIEKTEKDVGVLEYYSAQPLEANSSYVVTIMEFSSGTNSLGSAMFLVQTSLYDNKAGDILLMANNLTVELTVKAIQVAGHLQFNFATNVYAKICIYKFG